MQPPAPGRDGHSPSHNIAAAEADALPLNAPDDPRQPDEAEVDGGGAERLQKLIARAGIASRRAAEELILQGKVSVNGHLITELGHKADPHRDRILVNGYPLKISTAPPIVVLLHKPKGVVTTRDDPAGRTTVLDLLPGKYRHLHPVGRLDFDTSGALLLTDDGELTHLLTHPRHGVAKTYHARVRGPVTSATIARLAGGVVLEGEKTSPCKVRVKAATENNVLLELILREGRNRQVRRMLEAVGHPVSALRRVEFAGLDLSGLPGGAYRQLLPGEVSRLRRSAEQHLSSKTESQRPAPRTPKPAPAKGAAGKSLLPKRSKESKAPRVQPGVGRMGAGKGSATDRQTATTTTADRQEKSRREGGKKPASRRVTTASPREATPDSHPLAQRIQKRWGKVRDV